MSYGIVTRVNKAKGDDVSQAKVLVVDSTERKIASSLEI